MVTHNVVNSSLSISSSALKSQKENVNFERSWLLGFAGYCPTSFFVDSLNLEMFFSGFSFCDCNLLAVKRSAEENGKIIKSL
jgi:hypothetical protein